MKIGGLQIRELSNGFVLLVTVVAITAIAWLITELRPKRFTHYERTIYMPDKAEYCPGETLTFTPTLVVERAPVTLELTTTFYELDPPHSVGPRDLESSVSRSVQLETGKRTNVIRMLIPDLPPQRDYIIIRALESTQGDSVPSYTKVPFAIRNGC
jgi:hypothetical protein